MRSDLEINSVFLLTGTNLGNRLKNLSEASDAIGARIGKLERVSSVYETRAWGKTDQQDFLNQVLHISTVLTPLDLLKMCLSIEQQMGRVRKERWGERTIDIDVLYFNDLVINTEELIIPHPYLHQRRFTLVPLVEIAPKYNHPFLGKTNEDLLQECEDVLDVDRMNGEESFGKEAPTKNESM